MVNGVANRDLVTGQSTAGQLNARSVAEVNVATGAYDVRYGNALSGRRRDQAQGGRRRALRAASRSTAGSYGGRAFQVVVGGPDPWIKPALKRAGLGPPGTFHSIVDLSGNLFETRFRRITGDDTGLFETIFKAPTHSRLHSSYEDQLLRPHLQVRRLLLAGAGQPLVGALRADLEAGQSRQVELQLLQAHRDRPGLQPHVHQRGRRRRRPRVSVAVGAPHRARPDDLRGQRAELAPVAAHALRHRLHRVPGLALLLRAAPGRARQALERIRGARRSRLSRARRLAAHRLLHRHRATTTPGRTGARTPRRLQASAVQRFKRHEIEIGIEHEFQNVQYLTIDEPVGLRSRRPRRLARPLAGAPVGRRRLPARPARVRGLHGERRRARGLLVPGARGRACARRHREPQRQPGTRDAFYDETGSFFGRRYKLHISPRVIVAHPITENSSFFFNYGQFTQNPSYRYVYSKLTSISSESFPLLGNPEPEPAGLGELRGRRQAPVSADRGDQRDVLREGRLRLSRPPPRSSGRRARAWWPSSST